MAARCVARGQAPDHRANDGRPVRVLPLSLRSRALAYIGERWGDEAVGAILKATLSGGVEPAFRRTIGLTCSSFPTSGATRSRSSYLPEIGARAKARAVADELLNQKRSDGTLHLAPALSPDGSQVAYFSEKDFYFVDLYLADGNTGQGEAPDPQVRRQQQLRDVSVHQLAGQLVAGRQVSRVRGQARRRGTTSSSWTWRGTGKWVASSSN